MLTNDVIIPWLGRSDATITLEQDDTEFDVDTINDLLKAGD
jgi:hypothetical protein